jgi:hypothetical protein
MEIKMKKTNFIIVNIVLTSIIIASSSTVNATVTQTNTYNGTVAGLPVSNVDLLQTNLSSITTTGAFNSNALNNFPDLANGSLGTAGALSFPGALGCVGPTPGATITFNLNLSGNPLGYDIFDISTFASWNTSRDAQEYSLLYSTYLAPTTFLPFYSIAAYNPTGIPFDPSTTKVNLMDSGAGPMLSNVAAVQLNFVGPILNGVESGYTMYREIDVTGKPSLKEASAAPEPGTLALLGIGIAGFASRLRRQKID